MKKKIFNLMLLVVTLLQFTIPVKADNYKIKELIPVDIKNTIVTNRFSYKNFYYNTKNNEEKKNAIVFTGIKNLTEEERPITISIALFNAEKKNIGTINYCTKEKEYNLAGKTEEKYVIEVTKEYLAPNSKASDVKFISVLSENETCRTTGSQDFVGETIEEIKIGKNTEIDSKTEFTINIYLIVGGVLLIIFIYIFMFTNRFRNMDGEDIRIGYKQYNQELKDKREYEARVNPPQPKEVVKTKTDEVLAQEARENSQNKSNTDLENMYK